MGRLSRAIPRTITSLPYPSMSSSLAPIPTATRLRDNAARMAADRDQRRTVEELELLNADSVDFPQNMNRTAIDDLWDKTPMFDEDAEMPFFVDEAAVIKRVAIKRKTVTPRPAVGAVPAPQAAPPIGIQKAAMTRSQVWGGVMASWSLVSPQFLVVAFAFSAGWIDANSKTRFGTFGSLMTGNVIDMSMAIARVRSLATRSLAAGLPAAAFRLLASSHLCLSPHLCLLLPRLSSTGSMPSCLGSTSSPFRLAWSRT